MSKKGMNRLWAPWRAPYIKISVRKESGCLFCRSLRSKQENYIFLKNKYSFAILNIFPYNNGHVMVSPVRHIGNLNGLADNEINDMFKTVRDVIRLLDRVIKPQGYNLGMNIGRCSGAGIPGHLHLHIVPRWEADTNFMPIISNTKIISQSLNELYQELRRKNSQIVHVKPKKDHRIRR